MTRVVFLDAAEEEMLEAAKFYEQQVPALGHRYLAAIQHTASLIESNPHLGSHQQGNIKRLLYAFLPNMTVKPLRLEHFPIASNHLSGDQ